MTDLRTPHPDQEFIDRMSALAATGEVQKELALHLIAVRAANRAYDEAEDGGEYDEYHQTYVELSRTKCPCSRCQERGR